MGYMCGLYHGGWPSGEPRKLNNELFIKVRVLLSIKIFDELKDLICLFPRLLLLYHRSILDMYCIIVMIILAKS